VHPDRIQALQAEIHHDRLLVHWNNGSWRIRFGVRGGDNRPGTRCVLKNGNWNIRDILLAQSLIQESRMGSMAKEAQRSVLIIPRHPVYFDQWRLRWVNKCFVLKASTGCSSHS
jgi:hypothetical protein